MDGSLERSSNSNRAEVAEAGVPAAAARGRSRCTRGSRSRARLGCSSVVVRAARSASRTRTMVTLVGTRARLRGAWRPAPSGPPRPPPRWPRTALWGTTLPSSSLARRCTASSASSSAIRRLAAVSSDFSADVSPGAWPASMRSWRRQVWIDSSLIPRSKRRPRRCARWQVQHSAPELRRIPTTSHEALPQGSSGTRVQQTDSVERGAHHLHGSRGGSTRSSTGNPAWPTPSTCPTRRPRPRSGSSPARRRSSPPTASPVSCA